MNTKLQGVYIPLITAFTDDGKVDYEAMEELVEFMIRAEVHGFFVLGSSGMGPVMTTQQRINTAEFVVKKINRRRPIILHAGAADFQTTVQLARHADGLGVDAVAVVPPFYYTDHTPWEVVAHFKGVAAVIKTPLFLYDNEKYSGFRLTLDSLRNLKENVPSLCGLKASYRPMATILEYIEVLPQDFSVMAGSSYYLFPAVHQGLSGAIPPSTSAIPEIVVALWNAVIQRKFDTAVALQQKVDGFSRCIERLGSRFGRSAYREAFKLRGLKIKNYPRWPSEELPSDAIKTIAAALKESGV